MEGLIRQTLLDELCAKEQELETQRRKQAFEDARIQRQTKLIYREQKKLLGQDKKIRERTLRAKYLLKSYLRKKLPNLAKLNLIPDDVLESMSERGFNTVVRKAKLHYGLETLPLDFGVGLFLFFAIASFSMEPPLFAWMIKGVSICLGIGIIMLDRENDKRFDNFFNVLLFNHLAKSNPQTELEAATNQLINPHPEDQNRVFLY